MGFRNIDERKFRDIVKKLTSQGARPKYADTQLTGDVPIQEEMKLLITGGSGFLASHPYKFLFKKNLL